MVSKICLDKSLSNLVTPHGSPCFEQEAELETTGGPFLTELP